MSETLIEVTLTLFDPQLNDEQLQEATNNLRLEVSEVDGVIQANLVPAVKAPPNSKGIGGFLINVLRTEVNLENLKTLVSFLGEHSHDRRIIEIEAEKNGKRLKIKISRPEDLTEIMRQIDEFMNE